MVVADLSGRRLRELRTDLQMVFQDPHAALNPSMNIETAVGPPAEDPRARVRRRAAHPGRGGAGTGRPRARPTSSCRSTPPTCPAARSSGRCMARAVILEPELLVADEPISMLDMSVRAKILQLMLDLKAGPGADLRLHHPRPGHREVLLRPRRDHVPGSDRRDRSHRGDLRRPQAPLHEGAPQGDPRTGPPPHGATRPTPRRDPRRGEPTAWVLVPSPLPGGCRGVRLGVARPQDPARGALDPPGRLGLRARTVTCR